MSLPQLGIPHFVDSTREALPHFEEWMGLGLDGDGEWQKRREGELELVCKIKKNKINKN